MRGSRAVLRYPHPEAGTPAPSADPLPGAMSRGSLTALFARLLCLERGVGDLQARRASPPLGLCMGGFSSLHPGGFELKCRARSCSFWNKSIYLSPGRLGVGAGRGVKLTPVNCHSKEAKINWVLRGLHLLSQHGTGDENMIPKITASMIV